MFVLVINSLQTAIRSNESKLLFRRIDNYRINTVFYFNSYINIAPPLKKQPTIKSPSFPCNPNILTVREMNSGKKGAQILVTLNFFEQQILIFAA